MSASAIRLLSALALLAIMPQHVNSQGPRGPPGDTGATGATGRTGRPGPSGPPGPVGPRGVSGEPGPPGPSAPASTGIPGPPGPPGYHGSPGYQGDRGATGATGAKGWQGATGAAGRVNAAPYPPTATTTTRPLVPCSGPVGPPGPRGSHGVPGARGQRGFPGRPGPSGSQGSPGPRGPAGRPGGGGNAGPLGPPGSTGPPGVPGRYGWKGARGPIGDTGATGATGIHIQDIRRRRRRQAAGCPGPKGPPGFTGAAGPPGLSGPPGPVGPSGPAGVRGERGPRGPTGHGGPSGQPGPPGPRGPHGYHGPKGATGPRGPVGDTGRPGVQGDTGLFRIVARSQISVDSVWPSYGPVNGGTRVTITGQFLSTASVTAVHLGRHTLLPNANGNDMNSVVVITPPIAIGSRLSEELLILLQLNDGSVLDTNRTFTYRLNPVFTDIEPRNHLLIGGTQVTVTGSKLDSIADPRINLTVVVTRVDGDVISKSPATSNSEPCKLPKADADGTKLVCRMPVLSLPEDLRQQLEQSTTGVIDNSNCPGVAVYLTSHGRAHARADIYVGLELDGFDHYQNINADRSDIKMKFALMPGISCQSEVVTLYPNDKDVLSIQGQHLQRGSHLVDFDIRLGSTMCVPVSLTDNQVDCRPPPKGPNDTFCHDDTLIRIQIGNANYNCSCNVRYVTSPGTPDSDKVALIVGLSVGLGLLLLLVIVVIVVVVACRRHRNKRTEQGAERNVAFTGNERRERYVELDEDDGNHVANPAAANEIHNNNEFACARADEPCEDKKYTTLGELDPTYNNPPCYSSLEKNYEC